MIRDYKFTVTAAGAAGAAAGTAVSSGVIIGKVLAVGVDYSAGTATADLVLSTVHAPTLTLLTLTNNQTDGWWNVRHLADDPAGADITYDGTNEVYVSPCVADYVQAVIAQANNAQTAAVTLIVEQ